jgi:hypothetical protein
VSDPKTAARVERDAIAALVAERFWAPWDSIFA